MAKTLAQANAEIATLTELLADKEAQLIAVQEQLTATNLDVESIKQSTLKIGATVKNNAEGKPEIHLKVGK